MFLSKFFILQLVFILTHTSPGQTLNKDIDSVLQRILAPIRKLSDDLPNHQIELQVEFKDSNPIRFIPGTPEMQANSLRLLRPHPYYLGRAPHHKSAWRSNKAVAAAAPKATAKTTKAPKKAPTTHQVKTTKTSNPKKRPVNIEDLEKALDKLGKKLITKPVITKRASTTISSTPSVPVINYLVPQTQSMVIQGPFGGSQNQNINDIMQLLKRGIQVERHVSRPIDDNLDWLEIRIPK